MLLTETTTTDDVPLTIITEAQENTAEKNYYIQGIFLQAEVKNKNGRYYPLQAVQKAVDKYNKDYIQTGRSLGELGHPTDSTGAINLHLASHKIVSLHQEGNNFIGKAKLLETPMGKIAKTLIQENVKLGVSLRGFGTLTAKNGTKFVGNDFVLSTIDIVYDPSAPDAFIHGIMENTERLFHDGELLQEDYNYIKNKMKSMTKNRIDEGALLREFGKFLNKIKSKY